MNFMINAEFCTITEILIIEFLEFYQLSGQGKEDEKLLFVLIQICLYFVHPHNNWTCQLYTWVIRASKCFKCVQHCSRAGLQCIKDHFFSDECHWVMRPMTHMFSSFNPQKREEYVLEPTLRKSVMPLFGNAISRLTVGKAIMPSEQLWFCQGFKSDHGMTAWIWSKIIDPEHPQVLSVRVYPNFNHNTSEYISHAVMGQWLNGDLMQCWKE